MTQTEIVAITGATGHIGGEAARLLLTKGRAVRVVARNAEKLNELKAKGAEPFAADLGDTAAVERAFSGVRAVFAMIPPNVAAPDVRADQNRIADSLIRAIRAAKVTHVVALSSLGAHRGTQMGPVNGLHDWEEKLKTLEGVNILIVRPAYFMENLLMNVPMIKNNSLMGSPLKPDLPFAMIATQDIAAFVANALAYPVFSGITVRELHGQRDVTMDEARAAIGAAVGMPALGYAQFPYADAEKAMVGMGLSPDYAARLIEMSRSMNEGIMKPAQARDLSTTTATSIEEFAGVFKSLVASPAAAGS